MVAVIPTFVALLLISVVFTAHTVKSYKQGVVFRLEHFIGQRRPDLVMMPIESQGLVTRDNLSVDVSACSYYRVLDVTKPVVALENIKEIAETTLRQVVGQHTLDDMLAKTSKINVDIQQMLGLRIADLGVLVMLVGLKDIRLPETMTGRRHSESTRRATSGQGSLC
jgi:regulator of protease activity HflC (stomatin/prohibitin superfamily)